MNIAMDSQWKHDASNFAMDNNDYEKAFESYISDVEDDDDGEFWIFFLIFAFTAADKKRQRFTMAYLEYLYGSKFLMVL